MHCQAYRNHDAWRSSCISRGRCVCACARVHLCVCVYVGGCTHACADQTCRSGGSTTSCCSSAYSRLRLKKRHQQAAAAAVDSELVSAMSPPAARRTPCDRFGYGWCDDSTSTLRNCKLHVGHTPRILIIFASYVRCALARTGSLQPVRASSNRSSAWRFGSQGTGAHRRPRGRCAVDAMPAACQEVAAEAACEVAKCDQCGCGG